MACWEVIGIGAVVVVVVFITLPMVVFLCARAAAFGRLVGADRYHMMKSRETAKHLQELTKQLNQPKKGE
jgi:hypothetical protein